MCSLEVRGGLRGGEHAVLVEELEHEVAALLQHAAVPRLAARAARARRARGHLLHAFRYSISIQVKVGSKEGVPNEFVGGGVRSAVGVRRRHAVAVHYFWLQLRRYCCVLFLHLVMFLPHVKLGAARHHHGAWAAGLGLELRQRAELVLEVHRLQDPGLFLCDGLGRSLGCLGEVASSELMAPLLTPASERGTLMPLLLAVEVAGSLLPVEPVDVPGYGSFK